MARLLTYVDTNGAEIVKVGRLVGRVVWAPDRHPVTEPAELELLESLPVRFLKWDGAAVVTKTRLELEAQDELEDQRRSTEEAAAVGAEALRDLINARLAALGQAEISEAEEASRRKTIRDRRAGR